MRVSRSIGVMGALLTALAVAAPAQATFPGANGRIAFSWSRGGEAFESPPHPRLVGVVSVRPDGRDWHLIARGGTSPVYSPSGRSIAFIRESRLWVAAADGGHARALTPAGWAVEYQRWSPGGTRLAFVRAARRGSWHALYTVRPDGTELKRLLKAPTSIELSSSPWAPSRKAIAYTQIRFNSRPLVRIVRDGHITTFVPLGGGATWSRHGLIAYEIPSGFTDLSRVCLKRAATGEPLRCFGETGVVTGSPVWAPGGTRLMLTRTPQAGSPELWVVRPDGTVASRAETNANSTPIFSPDGTRLAFSVMTGAGGLAYQDLFVMGLDGSARRQLARGGQAEQPDWQPR
jgi:Tol biopolymer transport system component